MLDIRLLREQPDVVIERLAARGGLDARTDVEKILECDVHRRAAETAAQISQAECNRLSKEIGARRKQSQPSAELEARVRSLNDKIIDLNFDAAVADTEQRDRLLRLPNLPHPGCPVGAGPADNPVARVWGEPTRLAVKQPADHLAIGTRLGLFDPERAARLSGNGFVLWTGAGARLERSLINFLLDLHTREHAYTEVSPPFLVRRECMVGTTQLPKFEEDMYGVWDSKLIDELLNRDNESDKERRKAGLFLTPTAEVPVTNIHREEILPAEALPKRFAAYTPCFRREAGSAGRETRGLIRLHQFDKVELVKIVAPETSYEELERLTADAERVLQLLGLHYRVIELCTGDLGFGSARTYDIEVWAPGQNAWLEVSSCSNFEDYQARRMNLRFKDPATGKNRFPHTLNGSGTALPRLVVALLETYQQPDGGVLLPGPLHGYFGADRIG